MWNRYEADSNHRCIYWIKFGGHTCTKFRRNPLNCPAFKRREEITAAIVQIRYKMWEEEIKVRVIYSENLASVSTVKKD